MPATLNGETRLFPIIGDPIKLVQSPQALTRGFEARRHNALCMPMQVPGDDLDIVMRALPATGHVDRLLVTMPHKSRAFAYCTTRSDLTERSYRLTGRKRKALRPPRQPPTPYSA